MARVIVNADVKSYYPSLMIQNGYLSRNMRSPDTFKSIYEERIKAKAAGDTASANALKLIVNTTYGATLNRYNDLYDPLMARSVCISGQLYLLELACRLVAEVPTLRLIQLNTDGIMVSMEEAERPDFESICGEWQGRTGFVLEYDEIEKIVQANVNNFAARMEDGHVKVKGGYLVRGLSRAGAFSVNNNATVVADAVRSYLLDGTPVRETVESCDEPAAFQLVAKAGGKYSRVFQEVGGAEEPRQKCNRVFACRDDSLGTLYKVKASDGSVAKIESLPEHCLVSNGGMADISEIDKEWYVALALKRAAGFEPEEKEKKEMATTSTKTRAKAAQDYASLNIFQKLAMARKMFSDKKVKKSGANNHLEFEYFELGDIVPPEVEIFAELGLVEYTTKVPEKTVRSVNPETGEVTETVTKAVIRATLINADAPDERLDFELDWPHMPVIKNKNGVDTGNDLQRQGAEQTYLRRYIKHQILDVCDPDEVDPEIGSERAQKEPAKSARDAKVKVTTASKPAGAKVAAKARPAAGAARAETAKKIVDPDGAATPLQIRQLKNAIRKTKEACGDDPEVAQLVATIGAETDNLKGSVTKKACEGYIRSLGELKEKHDKAAE